VSGTDGLPVDGQQRSALIKALTTAGWLTFAAWLANLVRQVDFARTLAPDSPLGGLWERRIEAISFIVYPQNVVVLAPAVIAAIIATLLAGPLLDLRTAILLRITRWSCVLMIAVAAVSSISIAITSEQGISERGALAFRIGGALLSSAFIVVLRAVERTSPAA
jgi:hypothetical protein